MIEHVWTSPDGVEIDLSDRASGVRMAAGGIEGLGDGDVTDFVQERAVLDGQTFNGFKTKPRSVFWPIVIDGDAIGWEDQQRAFWTALPPGRNGSWKVTTPGGSVRTLPCRYVPSSYAPDLDPTVNENETVGVTLIADDPFWHGPTVLKAFQTAETPRPFYSTGPEVLNIMSSNTVDTATMTNVGDVPTWSIITINGPATAFSLSYYFNNTPADIAGSVALAADQCLEIDTHPDKQTVRRYNSDGSYDVVFDSMDQIFWRPFPPGVDVPIFIELNGSGSMLIEFDPLYRRAY